MRCCETHAAQPAALVSLDFDEEALPVQVLVQKQVPTMQALMANAQLADAAVLSELSAPNSNSEVNRWDLIQRGDG